MMIPGMMGAMAMVGGGPPSLGQPWEGGYYIGNIDVGGTLYALVLAPKSSGQNNSLQWKTSNSVTPGTSSTVDGWANSNSMNDASHPAAYFCRGLIIGGYNDWYFPAKDELDVLYTNKTAVAGGDAIDADSTYYWASTEDELGRGWLRRLDTGSGGYDGKSGAQRVRAVRRVAL